MWWRTRTCCKVVAHFSNKLFLNTPYESHLPKLWLFIVWWLQFSAKDFATKTGPKFTEICLKRQNVEKEKKKKISYIWISKHKIIWLLKLIWALCHHKTWSQWWHCHWNRNNRLGFRKQKYKKGFFKNNLYYIETKMKHSVK